MDPRIDDVLAKHTDPYEIRDRLGRIIKEESKLGEVLWELDRTGRVDCANSWLWPKLAEAPKGSFSGNDLAALFTRASQLKVGTFRSDSPWNIYFSNLLEALEDRSALVALHDTVAEPFRSWLGYHLVRHGDLAVSDLSEEALPTIAAQQATGTNWGLDGFDAVWPGDVGGRAMAIAAAAPETEIWSVKVVERALPHASDAEQAAMVLNVDYSRVLVECAELLGTPSPGLADALTKASLEHASEEGIVLAAILLGRVGRLSEAPEIAAKAVTQNPDDDGRVLLSEAIATLPEDRQRELVLPLFDESWGYARWAYVPAMPQEAILTVACKAALGLPRGEPYALKHVEKAFDRMPREAAAFLAAVDVGKAPQRHVVVRGLAAAGGPDAWPRLVEHLADGVSAVQAAAVKGLSDPDALPHIEVALKSRKKNVRLGAAKALAALPKTSATQALAAAVAAKEKTVDVKKALQPLLGEAVAAEVAPPPISLQSKRADDRIAAAREIGRAPTEDRAAELSKAFDGEKSKRVREVLATVLEACLASDEAPLAELDVGSSHDELVARFGRRRLAPPVSLDGLSLSSVDGTAWPAAALSGLLVAFAGGEDLAALRPHLDAASASALWHRLHRLASPTDAARGWVVQALPALAREADLADYGRGLDDKARGGDHLEAFAKIAALASHGSSAALQWVDHWARRARSNGLRERSGAALDAAGAALGLTRDELAERVLGSFGLDARGRRDFDYQGKTFTLVLTPELGFAVRLDDRARKDLPAAKSPEDKARRKDFSALKKQLRTARKAVIERLEAAMIDGRAWTLEAWQEVFSNPVQRRLAEQLVWWDVPSSTAFRVAEDGSFADVEDETIEVAGPIRIAHALHLGEAAGAWGDVVADYELLPPFRQLDRPVLAPERPKDTTLDTWIDDDVGSGALRGFMARGRWIRGEPQDGGAVLWMLKPFRAAGVTAVLDFEPGLGMGYDYEDQQRITDVRFYKGVHTSRPWGDTLEEVPLGKVDPVVFSEVVGAVGALFQPAE